MPYRRLNFFDLWEMRWGLGPTAWLIIVRIVVQDSLKQEAARIKDDIRAVHRFIHGKKFPKRFDN